MAQTKRRRKKVKSTRRAHKRRRNLLLLLLVVLTGIWGFQFLQVKGFMPANQTAEEWYDISKEDVVLVKLPADDAPHTNYTEWWYYNGHLEAQDGHKYSFHYTLFLLNAMAVHTVIHASFVDHQTGKRYTYQSRTAGNPSLHTKNRFDFTMGDWVMQGANGQDKLRGKSDDFSFNLDLKNLQPPVFQGGTGLLDFKEAGESYYYSRPRMAIEGYAGISGKEQMVTGTAWFDHQWGDFRTTVFGWDWFALQLDDGADVMLYQLYANDKQPILVSGTYTKDGITTQINRDDVISSATDHWKSPLSNINYPLGWLIEIPKKNIKVTVSPVHRASEFDGRKSTYNLYWEGPVRVSGTHKGKGFLEIKSVDNVRKMP